MASWSLSHIFSDVSLIEFKDYTEKLTEVFEGHCGTKCTATVKLYSGLKLDSGPVWREGDAEFIRKRNNDRIFFSTNDVSEVTDNDFANSVFAEVLISPNNKVKAPEYARAHLEVKGNLRGQMSFSVEGGDTSNISDFVGTFGFKVKNTGYKSHNKGQPLTMIQRLKRAL